MFPGRGQRDKAAGVRRGGEHQVRRRREVVRTGRGFDPGLSDPPPTQPTTRLVDRSLVASPARSRDRAQARRTRSVAPCLCRPNLSVPCRGATSDSSPPAGSPARTRQEPRKLGPADFVVPPHLAEDELVGPGNLSDSRESCMICRRTLAAPTNPPFTDQNLAAPTTPPAPTRTSMHRPESPCTDQNLHVRGRDATRRGLDAVRSGERSARS